jgi:hypothetical protein
VKVNDWQARLDAYIAAASNRPFSYDHRLGLDCCTFTFSAIAAQTGRQIGEQFRGRYTTLDESLALMKAYCGRPSLPHAIKKLMGEAGYVPVDALHAQRGDALISPNGGGYFLGVLDLNGMDIRSVGEFGVRRVPISVRCRAWRIE